MPKLKFQTMLLPTGHWLAVVTGDPLPEKHVEVLKELFKKSGALEVLHAPAGNIEIVNAVVDSEAIFYSHAEPEVEIEVEDEEPVDADPVFVPAPVVDVVEPVGAGDAFASGFLAATLDGADLETRLAAGHEAAARVLRIAADLPPLEPAL